MNVLVVNAGSSSVKLALLDGGDRTVAASELDAPRAAVDAAELRHEIRASGLDRADVVGHRIVHGGERFHDAVLIDADVEAALRGLVDLAPLHQPKSIAALDAVSAALPNTPAVACFDTAFHATLPPDAATYALPAAWRERWRLRRYGFHGLSHAWVARHVADWVGSIEARIVSCHLGAGASLCAIAGGRSVDTTMGFTPLEGLVMATRSGNVDPGMLMWLLERSDLSERALASALEHDSGLLGLTGSADMRTVLVNAATGDPAAQLGLDVYIHRLRGAIAAMAAALAGLDVVAFTGGVGERSAEIRARGVAGLDFLGIAVDGSLNAEATGDAEITAPGASVRAFVVSAREDLEIAHQARALLAR